MAKLMKKDFQNAQGAILGDSNIKQNVFQAEKKLGLEWALDYLRVICGKNIVSVTPLYFPFKIQATGAIDVTGFNNAVNPGGLSSPEYTFFGTLQCIATNFGGAGADLIQFIQNMKFDGNLLNNRQAAVVRIDPAGPLGSVSIQQDYMFAQAMSSAGIGNNLISGYVSGWVIKFG